jgi:hypothetical protein
MSESFEDQDNTAASHWAQFGSEAVSVDTFSDYVIRIFQITPNQDKQKVKTVCSKVISRDSTNITKDDFRCFLYLFGEFGDFSAFRRCMDGLLCSDTEVHSWFMTRSTTQELKALMDGAPPSAFFVRYGSKAGSLTIEIKLKDNVQRARLMYDKKTQQYADTGGLFTGRTILELIQVLQQRNVISHCVLEPPPPLSDGMYDNADDAQSQAAAIHREFTDTLTSLANDLIVPIQNLANQASPLVSREDVNVQLRAQLNQQIDSYNKMAAQYGQFQKLSPTRELLGQLKASVHSWGTLQQNFKFLLGQVVQEQPTNTSAYHSVDDFGES